MPPSPTRLFRPKRPARASAGRRAPAPHRALRTALRLSRPARLLTPPPPPLQNACDARLYAQHAMDNVGEEPEFVQRTAAAKQKLLRDCKEEAEHASIPRSHLCRSVELDNTEWVEALQADYAPR